MKSFDITKTHDAAEHSEASRRWQATKTAHKAGRADFDAIGADLRRHQDRIGPLMLAYYQAPTPEKKQALEELFTHCACLRQWIDARAFLDAEAQRQADAADRDTRKFREHMETRGDLEKQLADLEKDAWPLLSHGQAERDILALIARIGIDDEQSVSALERMEELGWKGPQS
jgi:hypothetical protein